MHSDSPNDNLTASVHNDCLGVEADGFVGCRFCFAVMATITQDPSPGLVHEIIIRGQADGRIGFALGLFEALLFGEGDGQSRMGRGVIRGFDQGHPPFAFRHVPAVMRQGGPGPLVVGTHFLSRYFSTSS